MDPSPILRMEGGLEWKSFDNSSEEAFLLYLGFVTSAVLSSLLPLLAGPPPLTCLLPATL
jgi:hypothetical protein